MLKLSLTKLQEGQLLISARGPMTVRNIGKFRSAIDSVIGRYDELLIKRSVELPSRLRSLG